MRLDIYLVGYGGERGDEEKRRETQRERNRRGKGRSREKGEIEAASLRGR